MANNKETENRTSIDELNDSLSGFGEKVQKNKNSILWAILGIVVVVLGIYFLVENRKAGIEEANNAIAPADLALMNGEDSVALAQYEVIAADYGHDAGNRAHLQAAILLYEKGDYEKALEYLKGYDANDNVVGPASYSLMGDCYVNLDNLNEALNCYDKAISMSDANPVYTPFFMIKKANIYREQKEYDKEVALYEEIKSEYPEFGKTYGIDIEKYLSRAKYQAEK